MHDNEAVASASSDTTVKLWRPFAAEKSPPQTLGTHGDYVKAIASPDSSADWVASGSLDHHIGVWDINEGRERQRIRSSEPGSVKGSIYALAARENLVASGGTENIVKLWDPRSGKRASQLIGHTDNIRSIMLSDSRILDTVISASSDRTVKIWSITAGRCLYSLSMHNDSVWSLYSVDPSLDVFYSGDRSGLIVRTDSREKHDIDEGYSIGIGQETEGINRLVVAGEDIWAATANSNINRWRDASAHAKLQRLEDAIGLQRSATARTKSSISSLPATPPPSGTFPKLDTIPLTCVLRIPDVPGNLSRNQVRQSALARRRTSLASIDSEVGNFAPLRSAPEDTIVGQNGLIKHAVLNDKRHVLTADTAGQVLLWDLLQCIPIRSYGKVHLDEVFDKLNKPETVPQWCEIDTRTGTVACTLDQDHCFSAEVYADELGEFSHTNVRDDERINLGEWVLRYLFANLLHEEIRRDEAYRLALGRGEDVVQSQQHELRADPTSETFFVDEESSPMTTPVAAERPPRGPEMSSFVIGAATPGIVVSQTAAPIANVQQANEEPASNRTQGDDYFTAKVTLQQVGEPEKENQPKTPQAVASEPDAPTSPNEPAAVASPKDSSQSFGKRLKNTFTPKKLGKSSGAAEDSKTAQAAEQESDAATSTADSGSDSSDGQDTMLSVINTIRAEYAKQKQDNPSAPIQSLVRPILPTDYPVLEVPGNTAIIIQEDHPASGGVADLFEGYRNQLGRNVDLIEKIAPRWLGGLLLKVR